MAVLYIFRDSERDAEGWMVQKWQFQCDVLLSSPSFKVLHFYE